MTTNSISQIEQNNNTLKETDLDVQANLIIPENRMDMWARKVFFKLCSKLKGGRLSVKESGQHHYFGQSSVDSLDVQIEVLSPKAYRRMLVGGSIGAAESYMEGEWHTTDLTDLIRLLLRNRQQLDQLETGMARVTGWIAQGWHKLNRNTLKGSKKNIAAHYDLGNEFFSLFLDANMMYSSGIYPTGEETLEQASNIKLRRICEKLDLQPSDHLMEIGTGWGGMAAFAAQHYGCKVTTTTISQEQYEAAKAKIEALGLSDQVQVIKQDYRELAGQYDKLVSIEMVEAVGHQYLDGYFDQVSHLLKPNGMALIQAITIDDLRYASALNSVDFIKRYIFPGSFIPCVHVLIQSAAMKGLRLFNLEDIGTSYALTLQHWRERFMSRLAEVREQGFDETFIKMWEFYLCYCEGGFRERAISDVQLLFTKEQNHRHQWLPGA